MTLLCEESDFLFDFHRRPSLMTSVVGLLSPGVSSVLQHQELLCVLTETHPVPDIGVFVYLVRVQQELIVADLTAVPHHHLDHVPHVAVPELVLLDAHLVDHLAVAPHGRESVDFIAEPTPVFTAILHVVAENFGPLQFTLVMRGLSSEFWINLIPELRRQDRLEKGLKVLRVLSDWRYCLSVRRFRNRHFEFLPWRIQAFNVQVFDQVLDVFRGAVTQYVEIVIVSEDGGHLCWHHDGCCCCCFSEVTNPTNG